MFLAEREKYHKCGYHYRFLFWTNTDSLLGDKSVNQECEKFGYKPVEAQKKLSYYVKKLETKPTHYIYSLEIPVSMTPSEIREKLKDRGLNLFFIDGEQVRFPSIYFSYKYYSRCDWKNTNSEDEDYDDTEDWRKAEKDNEVGRKEAFEELVNKVKSVSSVVNKWGIDYMGNGIVGDTMFFRKGYVELMFEVGTDLSKAITVLEKAGAEIKKTNNPETYCVQVVDISPDIEEIKHKLKPYSFIKGVTEYTKNRHK